ncbi:MAG: right-handed parallel beta-helix repeat-containing protein [Candidatus Eisenbacteria bacterium]
MIRLLAARFVVLLLVGLSSPPAWAATTHLILPDGTGDFPDIRSAIVASASGDTLVLGDGTFTGPDNRSLSFLGRSLVVRSLSGSLACVIDCENAAGGFRIQGDGITITRGYAETTGGGAILCQGPIGPVIRNCRFVSNRAVGCGPAGGAIRITGCAMKIYDCLFEDNNSAGFGGGIACHQEANVELLSCTFLGNAATEGGAVEVRGSTLTLTECLLIRNEAYIAGAASAWDSSTFTVRRCTLAENMASGDVSEICVPGGSGSGPVRVFVEHSILANGNSRAIFCGNFGAFDVACSDIYGHPNGNWTGCTKDLLGVDGNICEDPLFCDEANDDFTIRSDSPCGPDHDPECGLIGALPVGCYAPAGAPAIIEPAALALRVAGANPARGEARIVYSIPPALAGSPVTITVHDATGRLVRRLFEGNVAGDTGLLAWDGRSGAGARAPWGIYFFRIVAGSASATEQIVLLE